MKSILLVEDDPFLLDIYGLKFKEAGFKLDIVKNGNEVLKKLGESDYDLLVLDIVLPQVDGWHILKEIKSNSKLKKIKVIILSNLGQKEEVERGKKLGASKYLIKANYTPSEVIQEIKKII